MELLIAAGVCFLIGSLGCFTIMVLIKKLFSLRYGSSILVGTIIFPIVVLALCVLLVRSWPPNVDGLLILGLSVLAIMTCVFGLIGGPLAFIAVFKEDE
ncbi:MAG TPA: hypothetical protein VF489_05200 [Sphingobium sp.]